MTPYLKPAQVAELLSVSVRTVYRLIEDKKLEAEQIGPRTTRILTRSVIALAPETKRAIEACTNN